MISLTWVVFFDDQTILNFWRFFKILEQWYNIWYVINASPAVFIQLFEILLGSSIVHKH